MTSSPLSRRQALTWASALAAGLSLAACSSSPSPQSSPAASTSSPDYTFRFGQAGQVGNLDPAASLRMETHRISVQILENLLGADPDTGEPTQELASSWEKSEDGLTYRLTLTKNILFSDGSPLDAQTLESNLGRWKTLASGQVTPLSAPFAFLFADSPQPLAQASGSQEEASASSSPSPAENSQAQEQQAPLVSSWQVETQEEAIQLTFHLSRPSAAFLKALTQPALGILPQKLINSQGQLTGQILGTGPFQLESQEESLVRLVANPHYRGQAPQVTVLEFVTLPDAEKRYYQLLENQIDAYDQVALKDYVPLARAGYAVQSRDPYSLAYVDMNLAHPAFADARARSALNHAVNRSALISAYYPQGSSQANDFLPALFQIRHEDTPGYYSYNRERAQELLAASSYQQEPIDFYYPTNLSSPALPNPEGIYALIAADLVAAGFVIVPKPYTRQQVTSSVPQTYPNYGLELTGFVGTFRDPAAFLPQVLAAAASAPESISQQAQPSADAPTSPTPSPTSPSQEASQVPSSYRAIMAAINRADAQPSLEEQRQAYREVNLLAAQLRSALPLVYPVSGVTQGQRVARYTVNATCLDEFSQVTLRS